MSPVYVAFPDPYRLPRLSEFFLIITIYGHAPEECHYHIWPFSRRMLSANRMAATRAFSAVIIPCLATPFLLELPLPLPLRP